MVFETGFQAKVCTLKNVLSNLLKQLNCLKDGIYLTICLSLLQAESRLKALSAMFRVKNPDK